MQRIIKGSLKVAVLSGSLRTFARTQRNYLAKTLACPRVIAVCAEMTLASTLPLDALALSTSSASCLPGLLGGGREFRRTNPRYHYRVCATVFARAPPASEILQVEAETRLISPPSKASGGCGGRCGITLINY